MSKVIESGKMKYVYNIIIVVCFTLVFCDVNFSDAAISTVTLYTEHYQRGQSHTMHVNKCENVPDWINDRASSVDTHDTCIKLCTKINCHGRCVQYGLGIENDEWLEDLNDEISSVAPCDPCSIFTETETETPDSSQDYE